MLVGHSLSRPPNTNSDKFRLFLVSSGACGLTGKLKQDHVTDVSNAMIRMIGPGLSSESGGHGFDCRETFIIKIYILSIFVLTTGIGLDEE
jgi:hypothetical protein